MLLLAFFLKKFVVGLRVLELQVMMVDLVDLFADCLKAQALTYCRQFPSEAPNCYVSSFLTKII